MRKKTTPITFFSDPSQSSTLSFHSLFQRSSDSTPEDESNLIHLMYNAFRCGAFNDPSVGSHEDWNSLFEHYNFHWRRCSLQGAIADESTRQSFQRICRSFESDDATERLLFSLHTAETVDDLRRILDLQREIGHADDHAADTLESVSDAMWSATTCILRLFTVFEAPEKISSLCVEARQIAKRWETLGSFAGRGITAVLTRSRECWGRLVEELKESRGLLDAKRFVCHATLLLDCVSGLTAGYAVPETLGGVSEHVDWQEAMEFYLKELLPRDDSEIPFVFLPFLNDDAALRILIEIAGNAWGSFKQSGGSFETPLRGLAGKVKAQKPSLRRLFFAWFARFLQRNARQDEENLAASCRALLIIAGEVEERAGMFWNVLCDVLDETAVLDGGRWIEVETWKPWKRR